MGQLVSWTRLIWLEQIFSLCLRNRSPLFSIFFQFISGDRFWRYCLINIIVGAGTLNKHHYLSSLNKNKLALERQSLKMRKNSLFRFSRFNAIIFKVMTNIYIFFILLIFELFILKIASMLLACNLIVFPTSTLTKYKNEQTYSISAMMYDKNILFWCRSYCFIFLIV